MRGRVPGEKPRSRVGGGVALAGDLPALQYFPISPHLTRIRVRRNPARPLQEITCYPVTVHHDNPPPLFSAYKRTAPSSVCVGAATATRATAAAAEAAAQPPSPAPPSAAPAAAAPPPLPPQRLSSRHNSTLRMWSRMQLPASPEAARRRQQASRHANVTFLRERITSKLGAAPAAAAPKARSRPQSASPEPARAKATRRAAPPTRLSRSPDLASPAEVRKALQAAPAVRERPGSRLLPPGTVVRSSTAVFASARNTGRPSDDKSLRVTVAMSARGRELLRSSSSTAVPSTSKSPSPAPSTPRRPSVSPVGRGTSLSPSPGPLHRSRSRIISVVGAPPSSLARRKDSVSPAPQRTASRTSLALRDEGKARPKKVEKPGSDSVKKKVKAPGKSSPPSSVSKLETGKVHGSTTSVRSAARTAPEAKKKSKQERPPGRKKKSPPSSSDERKSRKELSVASRSATVADLSALDDEPASQFGGSDEEASVSAPGRSDTFFRHLLLRDAPSPAPSAGSAQRAHSSVLERARLFCERAARGPRRQAAPRAEPSLGLLSVYLSQRRPVTESKFRSLDRELSAASRSASPSPQRAPGKPFCYFPRIAAASAAGTGVVSERRAMFGSLASSRGVSPDVAAELKERRSKSEPPPATSSSTASWVSVAARSPPAPASPTRSPSSRRIRSAKAPGPPPVVEGPTGPSSASLADYPAYVAELLHSSQRSARFRELRSFYCSLERLGQLERATSAGDVRAHARLPAGSLVVDVERWRRLRAAERADEELRRLRSSLRAAQRDRGLLFAAADAERLRWRPDRGLRCKERSVDDLRHAVLEAGESPRPPSAARRRELELARDVYKPLWRGASVLHLAGSLSSVAGSHRGRAVVDARHCGAAGSRSPPPALGRRHYEGIGSRLWSSLSVEQVAALKTQLTEIYGGDEPAAASPTRRQRLQVRRNSAIGQEQLMDPVLRQRSEARRGKSESLAALPSLSEAEKRRLSLSLSREAADRRRGARSPSPTDATSPRTCYSLDVSAAEEEAGGGRAKNGDFLLVLAPRGQQRATEAEAEAEAETGSASSEASARTVIHVPDRDKGRGEARLDAETAAARSAARRRDARAVTRHEPEAEERASPWGGAGLPPEPPPSRSVSEERPRQPQREEEAASRKRARSAPPAADAGTEDGDAAPARHLDGGDAAARGFPSQSCADLRELFGETRRFTAPPVRPDHCRRWLQICQIPKHFDPVDIKHLLAYISAAPGRQQCFHDFIVNYRRMVGGKAKFGGCGSASSVARAPRAAAAGRRWGGAGAATPS
ncbi:serine/arginine repetitive matrix protein 2-like [Schistocerca gregaria]|uniref:serine/arginine repetitive matrix protein 2-like n=1 Tax=Schistocerca gregaria TaxID=7010 RepID=UPI00211DBCE4|nr:serine/arginine repetitive matrix protein 2-like [Schistocerca gregaria]